MTELELEDLRFNLSEGIDFLQKHIAGEPPFYGEMEHWSSAPAVGRLASNWPCWRSTNSKTGDTSSTPSAAPTSFCENISWKRR